MAQLHAFDVMLSADKDDQVVVSREVDTGGCAPSIFINFTIGEDADEVSFVFAPEDAVTWIKAFRDAAHQVMLGVLDVAYGAPDEDDDWDED